MDRQAKIKRNIEINSERANRQWSQDHRTEAPEAVRKYHRHMFEKAAYESDRQRNIKRKVK